VALGFTGASSGGVSATTAPENGNTGQHLAVGAETDEVWNQQQKHTASDGESGDSLSGSVGLSDIDRRSRPKERHKLKRRFAGCERVTHDPRSWSISVQRLDVFDAVLVGAVAVLRLAVGRLEGSRLRSPELLVELDRFVRVRDVQGDVYEVYFTLNLVARRQKDG
jgi:hypothetical protein